MLFNGIPIRTDVPIMHAPCTALTMDVAWAHGAALSMAGAENHHSAIRGRGITTFTGPQLQMVYDAGMQRGSSCIEHSHGESTIALRAKVTSELFTFLAHIPACHGVTVYTMQPTDVVVFLTMAWFPHHGRTVLSSGEIVPAASSIRGLMPALDYVFTTSSFGGGGGVRYSLKPRSCRCDSRPHEEAARRC